MTSSSSTSQFSCDLVEESKHHVAFLKTLHLNAISIQKPSNETFRRYSELWLPLVHRHSLDRRSSSDNDNNTTTRTSSVDLIPPADIAWLWHCHRLAPYRYAKHVQRTFFSDDGRHESKESSGVETANSLIVLDPKYPFVVQLEDNTPNQNLTFEI